MKYPKSILVKKNIFLGAALVFSASLLSSPITATPITHALVQVDDLCVLSEQILKDYAIVGMKISSKDSTARLAKSIEKFTAELKEVEHSHIGKELIDEIKLFDKHWQAIKKDLNGEPNKSEAASLYKAFAALVAECERVASDIEKQANMEGAHEVEQLSELAVESQRLAAIYMYKAWHVEGLELDKAAKQAFEEAETLYHELMKSDKLATPLKDKLKIVEKHLILFKLMIMRNSKTSVPALINRKADQILKEIRNIMEIEMTAYNVTDATGAYK